MNLRNSIKMLKRFRAFKKDIKEEMADPESKFNQFNMQRNDLGDVLYVQLNFTDADLVSHNYNAMRMVEKKVIPISTYLSDDLDWFDDMDVSIAQFYDKQYPTFSYIVKYTMLGVNEALNCLLWWAISLGLSLVVITIFALLVLALC